ncbi:MAG: hypothetical protein DWQ07_07845 [Chloroflexi bacterium]|nr:MAG: hypothetical protein DWQ07_07845 [Chloroflexota bacterium]MBL1197050.1 hypothetical protein [Chloroflexota bacterium]
MYLLSRDTRRFLPEYKMWGLRGRGAAHVGVRAARKGQKGRINVPICTLNVGKGAVESIFLFLIIFLFYNSDTNSGYINS